MLGSQRLILSLNSLKAFGFLNSFGTLFHKRLPLKHNAWMPYWHVLVEGIFNQFFLSKLYWVDFLLKMSNMKGGLNQFKDLNTSLVKFCKSLFLILTYTWFFLTDLQSLHLWFDIQVEECIYIYYLMNCRQFCYKTSKSVCIVLRGPETKVTSFA